MKDATLVVIVLMLVMVMVFYWSMSAPRRAAQNRNSWEDGQARAMIEKIRYLKDTRTGLCFAWAIDRGGREQVLTAVPCDAIPDELLTNAANRIPRE